MIRTGLYKVTIWKYPVHATAHIFFYVSYKVPNDKSEY